MLLHRVTDTISRLVNTTIDPPVPLSDYIILSSSCNTRHSLPFRSARRSVKREGMNSKATNYTLVPRSAGPSSPSLIYIPPFCITLGFPPSRGFSSIGNIRPLSLAIKCNNYNTMILYRVLAQVQKKKGPKRVPPPSIPLTPANAWGLLNPICLIPNTTSQLRYRYPQPVLCCAQKV